MPKLRRMCRKETARDPTNNLESETSEFIGGESAIIAAHYSSSANPEVQIQLLKHVENANSRTEIN